MTVKELIEELKEYDPDRDVVAWIDLYNGSYDYVRPVLSLDDDGLRVIIECE